jgi:hypothetical protein
MERCRRNNPRIDPARHKGLGAVRCLVAGLLALVVMLGSSSGAMVAGRGHDDHARHLHAHDHGPGVAVLVCSARPLNEGQAAGDGPAAGEPGDPEFDCCRSDRCPGRTLISLAGQTQRRARVADESPDPRPQDPGTLGGIADWTLVRRGIGFSLGAGPPRGGPVSLIWVRAGDRIVRTSHALLL